MKRKLTVITLTIVLALSALAGCEKNDTEIAMGSKEVEESAEQSTEESTVESSVEETTESPAEESATLIPEESETQSVEETSTESVEEVSTEQPTEESQPASEPVEEKASYSFKDLSVAMYASKDANIRNMPSTDGEKVGRIEKGSEVTVTGICNETGWYRIQYQGEVAYTSASNLSETKPVEEKPVVETPQESAPQPPAQADNSGSGSSGSGENANTSTPPSNSDSGSSGSDNSNVSTVCTHEGTDKANVKVDRYHVVLGGGCSQDIEVFNVVCIPCQTVISTYEEVAQTGHDSIVVSPGKSPTCTEDGYSEITSCSCGKRGLNGLGPDGNARVLPAYGHAYHTYCTGEMSEDTFHVKYRTECINCGDIQAEWWE